MPPHLGILLSQRNDVATCEPTWTNPEDVLHNERSQTQRTRVLVCDPTSMKYRKQRNHADTEGYGLGGNGERVPMGTGLVFGVMMFSEARGPVPERGLPTSNRSLGGGGGGLPGPTGSWWGHSPRWSLAGGGPPPIPSLSCLTSICTQGHLLVAL